ncbi:MAG: Txe/YoeB family addiction module toxin [Candidatus Kapabacteria bacterium]|jgi:toxin YoeB|nr:Txe/YoeB family addiction module toxin [Candidatus Kapabacteria bacterium]
MKELAFKNSSFDALQEWLRSDTKTAERIVRILQECRRTPFQGIGKPEPLKGNLKGMWSRRINEKDRIVYEVTETAVIVYSLQGHYEK